MPRNARWTYPGTCVRQQKPATSYPPVTVVTFSKDVIIYRDDIRKNQMYLGWRYPSPYSAEVRELVLNGMYHTSQEDYSGNLGWMVTVEPSLPNEDLAGLRSRAEVQALLKLKDQKVNLAQFFAERKMVERLALNTARDLCDVADAIMRKNPRGVERALRLTRRSKKADKAWRKLDPTGRWLEYQYGWLPLLSDVYGAAEALRSKDRVEMRVTCKGNASDSFTDTTSQGSPGQFIMPMDWLNSHKQEVKVSLTYIPNANWAAQVMSSTGISNPLLLQWELMPFSFVCDWFVPVGNFLNSLDATSGYEFLGGSITTYREVISKPVTKRFSQTHLTSRLSGYFRHMRFTRLVYGSSPFPTLPRMRAPWATNGATRFANALSLMRQAFK